MQRNLLVFVSIFAAVLVAAPCAAQHGPSGPTGPSASETPPIGNDLDVGVNQLKKFGIYDVFKERVKQQKGPTKSIAELLAEDKADASALVASMKLQCTVANAVLMAVDAGAHTKTFEVACASGTGYFLVQSDPPSSPLGFSCFAAETSRLADIAAKREPGAICGLPENPGSKPMAAAILQRAGKTCAVRDTKWMGQSDVSHTDYVEVACEDATGFVVASPLPGSSLSIRVVACRDSARQGVPCSMSDNGITMQTFKDALAQHNVACDAEDMRLIGQEKVKHRRVVEFLCPRQQPNGLVAYIPLGDVTAPFETADCSAASKRGAVCTLTKPK